MAWGRFGLGSLDDDQPIEFWMDDQNGQVANRDALADAGRARWGDSTRSGENLEAPSLADSGINVAVPRGMSRGDFYEYHYRVDPAARGFRLPADLNDGMGWRPKELALTKYNLPQRIWHGAPVPLKDAMAAILLANGPALYGRLESQQ